MVWNHRLVRFELERPVTTVLVEVFYGKSGKPIAWSDAYVVSKEGCDGGLGIENDCWEQLEDMAEALGKPILAYPSDFEQIDQWWANE